MSVILKTGRKSGCKPERSHRDDWARFGIRTPDGYFAMKTLQPVPEKGRIQGVLFDLTAELALMTITSWKIIKA